MAFVAALMVAADYEMGGKLVTRAGKLTENELAGELLLAPARAKSALAELCSAGFLSLSDGVYTVERFSEKTTRDPKAASRMRDMRERKRMESLADSVQNTVSVTGVTRNVTDDVTRRNVTDDVTESVTRNVTNERSHGRSREEELEAERDTETSVSGGEPQNAPYAFSQWLHDEAVSAGVLSVRLKPELEIRRDLRAARELLTQFGQVECETRARRLIAALASGEIIRGSATVRQLQSWWDWGCIAGRAAKRDEAPDLTAGFKRV